MAQRLEAVRVGTGLGVSAIQSFLRLLEMMPVLTPLHASSPLSREHSILGQRFITTSKPGRLGAAAAASLRTPNCIHTTLAPLAIASSTSPAPLGVAEDVDHVDLVRHVGETA